MPLQVIESTDPISQLVQLRTSAVYEMIISLQTLLKPGRHSAWANAARAALPADFLEELQAIYGPYLNGKFFFELAVDYHDHTDVQGFIDYVRSMSPVDFVFYVVGRVISREDIAATGLDYDALLAAMAATPYDVYCLCYEVPFEAVIADLQTFQNRLADLWQWYWDTFFQSELDAMVPHWNQALSDKGAMLSRHGGMALWENVTGKNTLLDPLPADQPFTEIVFIPLYLLPSPVFMHYGYGNITVLFDSERTEARLEEIKRTKEQALVVLKALGDSSRLDILRLVAQHEHDMHGKRIAHKLNLSASAVSRHLNQLKDAGLLEEESQDNRTITYRLKADVIKELPEHLWEVLYH